MGDKDLVAAPQIKIDADWVMEPEVPRPTGTFLQDFTRRCFMEDRIDLRIRISGFNLSPNADVKFEVTSAQPATKAVFVGTKFDDVSQARKDFRVAERRFLKPGSFLRELPEADSAKEVLFEVDATGANATSLVTSILIPDLGPAQSVQFIFSVTVVDQGQTLNAVSPSLEAVRWSADPAVNLNFKPTRATRIRPIIDGEAFFNRVSGLVQSSFSRVIIAAWSFWMDMFLTGEPSAAGNQLSANLKAAAGRGVEVLILVDFHNGDWIAPMLNRHLSAPKIFIRTATHPHKLLSALPGFSTQSGSYHEKYIIVDSTVAILGGIDFHPDRYNSPRHNFKPEYAKFRDQDQARGPKFMFPIKNKAGEEIKELRALWHDSAVEIEGPVVIDLQNDFGRRWDEASHTPPFVPERPNPPPAEDRNAQLVKTDQIRRTKFPGTLSAYTQAILEARHYIYIENQYFNFQPVGKLLEDALNRTPTLQLIVILPFDTEEAQAIDKRDPEPRYGVPLSSSDVKKMKQSAYLHSLFLQKQIVDRLRRVPNANNRVGFFALASQIPGKPKPEEIYPHSKIMIVDDTWAIVGSANVNGRGFKSDGEVSLVFHSRFEVTALRTTLWKEHLGVDLPTRKIRDFFKEWNNRAIRGVTKAEDTPPASLANQHAVVLTNVPAGVKYNGQMEFIANFFNIIDDEV